VTKAREGSEPGSPARLGELESPAGQLDNWGDLDGQAICLLEAEPDDLAGLRHQRHTKIRRFLDWVQAWTKARRQLIKRRISGHQTQPEGNLENISLTPELYLGPEMRQQVLVHRPRRCLNFSDEIGRRPPLLTLI
jgi:hypothetical protein